MFLRHRLASIAAVIALLASDAANAQATNVATNIDMQKQAAGASHNQDNQDIAANANAARILYGDEYADDIKAKYNLKDDATINFQLIPDDANVAYIDSMSVDISPDNLEPIDVYAQGSATDGVIDVFEVGCDECGPGESILLSLDDVGGVLIVRRIIKMKPGTTVELVRVTDAGLFAEIRSQDYKDDGDEHGDDEQGGDTVDVAEPLYQFDEEQQQEDEYEDEDGNYRQRRRRQLLRGVQNQTETVMARYASASISDALASTYNIPNIDELIKEHEQNKNDHGTDKNHTRRLASTCTSYRVVRLALRYDSGFCYQNGNSHRRAQAELRLVVADVSKIYQRQGLCIQVQICTMSGYCTAQW